MASGLNTYGYVGGNPINAIDQYGLQAIALPVPVNPATTSNPIGWTVLAGSSGFLAGTYIYNNFDEQILDAISWVLNENADTDNAGSPSQCDDEVNGLIDGLDQETDLRGRPKPGQFGNPNGNIQSDLDSLTGTPNDSGQVVLPDGSVVGVHVSATTGRPTLHINRPRGKQNIKIRY